MRLLLVAPSWTVLLAMVGVVEEDGISDFSRVQPSDVSLEGGACEEVRRFIESLRERGLVRIAVELERLLAEDVPSVGDAETASAWLSAVRRLDQRTIESVVPMADVESIAAAFAEYTHAVDDISRIVRTTEKELVPESSGDLTADSDYAALNQVQIIREWAALRRLSLHLRSQLTPPTRDALLGELRKGASRRAASLVFPN